MHSHGWTLDPVARELLDMAGTTPTDRVATPQPETRLILAILEDAVRTFQQYVVLRRGTPRQFRHVELWLRSNDRDWAFSFVNICEALDFDVDRCRAGLERWRRRQDEGRGNGVTVGARRRPVIGVGQGVVRFVEEAAVATRRPSGSGFRVIQGLRAPRQKMPEEPPA